VGAGVLGAALLAASECEIAREHAKEQHDA
jgi:hypothetical protein